MLETKKQRLLLTLQDSEGDHRISKLSTGTDVAHDGEKKGEEGGEEGGEEEEDDELHGMKCQAPVMEVISALMLPIFIVLYLVRARMIARKGYTIEP